MNKEELLQAIQYSEDINKRVGIDELLLLLAEYINDKKVTDEVDLYVADYYADCEAWLKLNNRMAEINKLSEFPKVESEEQ